MATNFPTSLDSLTNPATSDQLNSPSHAAQHTNANDAIEALEAKVGVDGSTVTTSHAYKIAQLESDIQNSAGDFIPLSVLGQPSGPAELNADGNLIVPENKIIIEGATADAYELTLQAPDVTSDITVTLPNASGTLALTTDVSTAITNLVSSAPATLDTLNELATALGNDANFATTTATSIGNKVSKAGGDTITSSTASTVPLVLKGASSQTANLQEWQDSAGNLLGRITSTGVTSFYGGSNIFPGDVRAGTSSYLTAALSVASRIATESGLVVRGFASQTANLQEWRDSSGTVLAKIDASGSGTFTGSASTNAISAYAGAAGNYVFQGFNQSNSLTSIIYQSGEIYSASNIYIQGAGNYSAAVNVKPGSTSNKGLVIRGLASQTGNLQEWQNNNGDVLSKITSDGSLQIGSGAWTAISSLYGQVGVRTDGALLGSLSVGTGNAGVIGLVVKGAASQTADYFQIQNSSGTVVVRADSSNSIAVPFGQISAASGLIGSGTTRLGTAGVTAYASAATSNGIIVRGAASQTANLQEWQDSAGTVLANITPAGAIKATDVTSSNTTGSLRYYWGNVATGNQSLSYITGATNAGLVIETINIGSANATFDSCIPLSIRGLPNQTGDLQRWINGTGTTLAKVDSTGAMFTITPADSTNTTQVATTAYVKSNIANLVSSAPATLDTLNELATALGNDANFSTTVTNSIALKAPLASPALTGTPTAPTATAGTNTTQLATTAFVKTEITSSVQPGAVYQTSAPSSPAVGQIWIDSDQDVTTFDSNIIRRKSITATAGQTVFTTDLPFIDGFEQVFFNGLLLLKTSDYTTSGGNTVTLTSAAAVSDIVEIVSVTGANSVTTYTQAEVDALLAANTSVAPISISTNTNLAAKKRYFVTSASALTLTLPATPALNDEVQIVDASGNALTYNITVARNGKLINGNAGNLIIDVNGGWYTLVFTGNTYGWKVA